MTYAAVGELELAAKYMVLKGAAIGDRGQLEIAARFLENMLKVYGFTAAASQAHQLLAELYDTLDRPESAQQHRELGQR